MDGVWLKHYSYITDEKFGQNGVDRFLGKPSSSRKPTTVSEKEKNFPRAQRSFLGFMVLRMSSPETPDRLKLELLKRCES